MAVAWRRWRGNSWCGHNWVTGSVCDLNTSSPSPLLSPFCQGERWHLLWERLTALMHISLTATLPAVTIRKEHMPELGTTSEGAAPQSEPLFCRLQYTFKVCIWSDCDSRLNGTEVWLCLTDSNTPQMDPITWLIVATSCLPFFCPQAAHCTGALQARWDNLISTAWPPFVFKDS